MLYTLLAAFGISKALPSACIVSYCQLIILLPVEIYFFLQDSSCRITDPEHLPQPSLQLFQVLCALTLPVGKLVADYVLKNHEVNKLLLSPAVLWKKWISCGFALTQFEITAPGQCQDFHGEVLLCAVACAVWDGAGFWFGLGPKWCASLTKWATSKSMRESGAPCSFRFLVNATAFHRVLNFWFSNRTDWTLRMIAVLNWCSFAKKWRGDAREVLDEHP